MQRYRVNYKLLIGLVVGTFMFAGSAYGLWWWQVDRNANHLIKRANDYMEKGDPREAWMSLHQYLTLRPDDARALIRYAHLASDIATDFSDPEWQGAELSLANEALNQAVTNTEIWRQKLQQASASDKAELLEEIAPREGEAGEISAETLRSENIALRKELVKILLMWGQPQKALPHLEKIIEADDGTDPEELVEIESQRIQCLAALDVDRSRCLAHCRDLTGYEGGEFNEEAATNPHVPQAYWALALDLLDRGGDDKKEQADRIIQRMVEMNPDLAEAHIKRHIYMRRIAEEKELKAAQEDLVALNDTSPGSKVRAERRAAEARAAEEAADQAAREALNRAHQLDPTDVSVLINKGRQSLRDYDASRDELRELLGSRADAVGKQLVSADSVEEVRQLLINENIPEADIEPIVNGWQQGEHALDQAVAYFDEGVEQYPENRSFYQLAANARFRNGDLDEALKVVNLGLEQFSVASVNRGLRGGLPLSNTKVDILLAQNNIPGIEEEIRKLRDTKNASYGAAADFHQARVYMVNQQWRKAEQLLRRSFPKLMTYMDDSTFRGLASDAGTMLGISQERLGKYDLAFESYEKVIKSVQPNNPRSLERLRSVAVKLQRTDEIPEASPEDGRLARIILLPESERDWESLIQDIDRQLARDEIDEGLALIKKAHVRMKQAASTSDSAQQSRRYDEALRLAEQAVDAEGEPRTNLWMAINMIAAYPETGPKRALEMLQQAIQDETLPDSIRTREVLAKLLGSVGGPDVVQQLQQLTRDMDDWAASQQATTLAAVAWQLQNLGLNDDAWEMMQRAVELSPNDLPMLKNQFELGYAQRNDERMKQAQAGIRDYVGETDPETVLAEARRKLIAVHLGELDAEELTGVLAQLDAAAKKRSDWPELQQVIVQISAVLGDTNKSIGFIEQMRTSNPTLLALHVKLLASERRFEEANQQLKRIPATMRTALLDQLHAEVLKNVGDKEGSYLAAEQFAESKPDDPNVQLWFAGLAREAGRLDEAEASLLQIADVAPSDLRIWEQLVTLYIQQRDAEKIADILRQAQLGVDEDALPDWMAKYYELFRRWQQAEKILLSIYGHRLDEPIANRQLAQFYISRSSSDRYVPIAAAPYINRILQAVYDGKLDPQNPHAGWARRQAAQMFFARGDYPSSLKAERLLTRYADNGGVNPEDAELLTAILSARMDPESYSKLVETLSEAKAQSGLSPDRSLLLGQMLGRLGQWEACRAHMDEAIARYPESAKLLAGYASLLIEREEFRDAERMIQRVNSLPGTKPTVIDLRITLASAEGDKEQVRKLLTSLVPRFEGASAEQLKAVPAIARLAERAGDYQLAIALLKEYVKREPAAKLELARMVAFYGDAANGLDMLSVLFDDQQYDADQVLITAVQMYRMRKAEMGDELDVAMNGLIRKALRRDRESARRLISQAEVLEVQERFKEAIEKYNELLARKDVPDLIRATAANNLAYVMAFQSTTPEQLDRALEAANEAVRLMGPISEVLDTRAAVHLAREDYEQALNDMQIAIRVDPTAGKYYHLARAELGLGNTDNALDAWRKAEELGTGPENIGPIEQNDLYRFKQQVDSLATSSAKL